MPGVEKFIPAMSRRLSTIADKAAKGAGKGLSKLPAAVPASNEGSRGFSNVARELGTPKFPAPSGAHAGSMANTLVAYKDAGPAGNSPITYRHDLAVLAAPLETLHNKYYVNGKLEVPDPSKPALDVIAFRQGLYDETIPPGTATKYVIDSNGKIYFAALDSKKKETGHIHMMARVHIEAKAGNGVEPRVVMCGKVHSAKGEDGQFTLVVTNESGHTMPEGDVRQEEFGQAVFAQTFGEMRVSTERMVGADHPMGPAHGSVYRTAPQDSRSIFVHEAERAVVQELVNEALKTAKLQAAKNTPPAPLDSDK